MCFRHSWETYKLELGHLSVLPEVITKCVIKENYYPFNFCVIFCCHYREQEFTSTYPEKVFLWTCTIYFLIHS